MPLIIKDNKSINIVSKNEVLKKIEDSQASLSSEEKSLQKLSPEVAERRREILNAKKHREYMLKVQKLEEAAKLRIQEEKNIDNVEVEVTNELVVETGSDPIIIKHDDVVKVSTEEEVKTETPNFEAMTKKELDEWAESNLGLALYRRKKKADLIEIIKNNL